MSTEAPAPPAVLTQDPPEEAFASPPKKRQRTETQDAEDVAKALKDAESNLEKKSIELEQLSQEVKEKDAEIQNLKQKSQELSATSATSVPEDDNDKTFEEIQRKHRTIVCENLTNVLKNKKYSTPTLRGVIVATHKTLFSTLQKHIYMATQVMKEEKLTDSITKLKDVPDSVDYRLEALVYPVEGKEEYLKMLKRAVDGPGTKSKKAGKKKSTKAGEKETPKLIDRFHEQNFKHEWTEFQEMVSGILPKETKSSPDDGSTIPAYQTIIKYVRMYSDFVRWYATNVCRPAVPSDSQGLGKEVCFHFDRSNSSKAKEELDVYLGKMDAFFNILLKSHPLGKALKFSYAENKREQFFRVKRGQWLEGAADHLSEVHDLQNNPFEEEEIENMVMSLWQQMQGYDEDKCKVFEELDFRNGAIDRKFLADNNFYKKLLIDISECHFVRPRSKGQSNGGKVILPFIAETLSMVKKHWHLLAKQYAITVSPNDGGTNADRFVLQRSRSVEEYPLTDELTDISLQISNPCHNSDDPGTPLTANLPERLTELLAKFWYQGLLETSEREDEWKQWGSKPHSLLPGWLSSGTDLAEKVFCPSDSGESTAPPRIEFMEIPKIFETFAIQNRHTPSGDGKPDSLYVVLQDYYKGNQKIKDFKTIKHFPDFFDGAELEPLVNHEYASERMLRDLHTKFISRSFEQMIFLLGNVDDAHTLVNSWFVSTTLRDLVKWEYLPVGGVLYVPLTEETLLVTVQEHRGVSCVSSNKIKASIVTTTNDMPTSEGTRNAWLAHFPHFPTTDALSMSDVLKLECMKDFQPATEPSDGTTCQWLSFENKGSNAPETECGFRVPWECNDVDGGSRNPNPNPKAGKRTGLGGRDANPRIGENAVAGVVPELTPEAISEVFELDCDIYLRRKDGKGTLAVRVDENELAKCLQSATVLSPLFNINEEAARVDEDGNEIGRVTVNEFIAREEYDSSPSTLVRTGHYGSRPYPSYRVQEVNGGGDLVVYEYELKKLTNETALTLPAFAKKHGIPPSKK